MFSGGLSRNTFGSPCGPSGLDAESRPCREPLGIPRTYEYGAGAEREIAQGLALSLDFVHRRYAHQFEVSETNRIWSDSGNAVVGYRNGRPEAILDLGTPASATRQYTGVTFGLLNGLSKTLHPYPDSASYSQAWLDVAALIWGGDDGGGGLLSFDWDSLDYRPAMAVQMPQVSSDGRTFTFVLRGDLKWSDGSPINADDFTFAFDQASREENHKEHRDACGDQ